MERDQLRDEVKKLPEKPGVYKFFDMHGNIIYIGKSVNLRQRVRSYFSQKILNYGVYSGNSFDEQINVPDVSFRNNGLSKSPGLNTRTKIMINSIERFETDETDSELEALLLEDRLIKEYLPVYNVKQKEFNSYCSVYLSNDEFPALKIDASPRYDRKNTHIMLFKNRYRAEEFIDIVSKYTGIRTCSGTKPDLHCMRFELSDCSAPCRENITTKDYNRIVNECQNILSGNCRDIQKKMESKMLELSGLLKFEEAGEIKTDIETIKNYSKRSGFISKFSSKVLILKESGLSCLTYLFSNGSLKNVIRNKIKDFEIELILMSSGFNSATGSKPNYYELYDRANILYSYIRNNPETVNYYFV